MKRNVTKEDYIVRAYSLPAKYGSVAKVHFVQADQLNKSAEVENLERQIQKTSQELLDLTINNNFTPEPLMKYWHTLLLSPITSKKTQGFFGHNQLYKDIHSARSIPFETKKEFYGKMEEIFNRGVEQESPQLEAKPKSISTLKELAMKTTEELLNENAPSKSKSKKVDPSQFDLFNPPKAEMILMDKSPKETLTELTTSKAMEGLAINEAQLKEVQQFRKNLNRHRVIKENFEQWFEYFTGIDPVSSLTDTLRKAGSALETIDDKIEEQYKDEYGEQFIKRDAEGNIKVDYSQLFVMDFWLTKVAKQLPNMVMFAGTGLAGKALSAKAYHAANATKLVSSMKKSNLGKKFIEVGQKIKKGDTVMIVEAMKTMNHVPSTQDGEVKKILVEDGQAVEFGQVLVILK